MKIEDYFQLTLEERIELEKVSSTRKPEKGADNSPLTLEEYYEIPDCASFLEKLRVYQINDVMSRRSISKYKLF